jgi:hypothetical protein
VLPVSAQTEEEGQARGATVAGLVGMRAEQEGLEVCLIPMVVLVTLSRRLVPFLWFALGFSTSLTLSCRYMISLAADIHTLTFAPLATSSGKIGAADFIQFVHSCKALRNLEMRHHSFDHFEMDSFLMEVERHAFFVMSLVYQRVLFYLFLPPLWVSLTLLYAVLPERLAAPFASLGGSRDG